MLISNQSNVWPLAWDPLKPAFFFFHIYNIIDIRILYRQDHENCLRSSHICIVIWKKLFYNGICGHSFGHSLASTGLTAQLQTRPPYFVDYLVSEKSIEIGSDLLEFL